MLGTVLIFLLVLSILVIVHELGHFIIAKRNGILVEEFGFGLPPKIWGKKIGDTLYSLNLLPFGGFVKLHGEMTEDTQTNPKRAFLNKPKLVRTSVIIAGVVMNFLLAIVSFAVVYSFSGVPRDTGVVRVLDVSSGSPAQTAQILVGDVIKKVDGKEVVNTKDFISQIESKRGKKVIIELQDRKVTLTPRVETPEGQGPLGVTISSTETYFPPIYQRPFYGIYYGFKEAFFWGENVLKGFGSIFTDLFRGAAPKDISGPIGVFAITTEASKQGILAVINLIGIISVNLAILNILPLPALDGGRLLFILIESVFGRKVLPKVEAAIHTIGFVVLIGLVLLISVYDVKRLVSAGSIQGFLESMTK